MRRHTVQSDWVANLAQLMLALLLVAILWGYVANVVKFVSADFQEPYKEEVLRGIGVFIPPVGVVIGYLEIEE